ncbi:MAG: glycosyltransferase family 39 protein, partial [Candidatus Dormibacteria bacterium]
AGLELAGRRTEALLAAAMVALLPEFSFRGMNISCDALVLTLCAATTWAMVRISRRGFSWPRGLLAAALLGLACLAKVTAFTLLPALALTILLQPGLAISRRVRHLVVLAVVPLLLAPYLVRNQLLYGDPFAAAALARAVPGAIVHHSLLSAYFALPFPTLVVQSFVARFGWMNLSVPLPVLTLLLIPGLCAVAALPRALRIPEQRTLLLTLLTAPVASVIALVGFNLSVSQAQGRYLFPALPAMAVAAVLLYRQTPGWARGRRLLVPALVGGYALLNLGIVLAVVRPAYGS